VDLREPTIDFLVTPSNGDAPLEVDARTTSDFLKQFKCQAAINGSVFAPFAKSNLAPMNIEGLAVSRAEVYSEANQYHSLVISTNHRAWIARTSGEGVGGFNALSGFYSVLTHGTNTGTSKDLHPRSSVGVSREGRWLIMMVVDGRQPGYSEGLSTAETGEWMRKLGAHDALNLDGGGSTALVVEGPKGRPRVMNRPSGPPPGNERRVANHLGVFARKLAE
jgi:exopolysaccharide biosynthesis protein